MFQKNKLSLSIAAIIAFALAPSAYADDYNYLSRSDKVSLTTGDAPKANLAIQTPTPWPHYVNRTAIPGNGRRAVSAMEKYYLLGESVVSEVNSIAVDVAAPSPANGAKE